MHHDVDAAEEIAGSAGGDGAAFGSGYIGRHEVVGMSQICWPRPRRGDDRRARIPKRRNDRLADTLGAAGDKRAFSIKFQVVAHQ
jgi:hypothetical protein